MGLLLKLFEKVVDVRNEIDLRPLTKAAAQADQIIDMTGVIIIVIYTDKAEYLKARIPQWSLENRTLMTFLGYISGIFAVAERRLMDGPPKGVRPSEIVLFRFVRTLFGEIPNTKFWLDASEQEVSKGGNVMQIAACGSYSKDFASSFECGAQDYDDFLRFYSKDSDQTFMSFRIGISNLLNSCESN